METEPYPWTPFWDEGMNAEERERRVTGLFALLEQKLGTAHEATDAPAERVFVFAPDRPTSDFDSQIQGLDVYRFSWGVTGRSPAVATESLQMAVTLTPLMFDVGFDDLYVFAFEAAKVPGDTILRYWMEAALEAWRIQYNAEFPSTNKKRGWLLRLTEWISKFDSAPADVDYKIQASPVPRHALLVFDWGDLIGEPPPENGLETASSR